MTLVSGKEQIAEEIINYSINTLIVHLPAFSSAISEIEFRADEACESIKCDTSLFLYSPDYIINSFLQNKNFVTRSILHSVFHCIFRHMYSSERKNRILWDLASDIACEKAINECKTECVNTGKEHSTAAVISAIGKNIKNITTENIYYWLVDSSVSAEDIAFYIECSVCDKHDLWYKIPVKEIVEDEYSMDGETPSIYTKEDDRPSRGEDIQKHSDSFNGNTNNDENEEKWERIAKKVNAELEYTEAQRGVSGGTFIEELKLLNREITDYSDFLRQFSSLNENIQINDDEFDYVYYTYGLKLFEKMPLIEPLESKEDKKIRYFIIAIDTSGSVHGDTVKSFIEKTYSILKNTSSFFSKTKVRIIQCDSAVQQDIQIEVEEAEKYISELTLHGFGGTDFRPVFSYVDNLIETGIISVPDGLIYFTDGDGIYPESPPAYKTAFVISDRAFDTNRIPSWAARTFFEHG